jgi:hypothetical protein
MIVVRQFYRIPLPLSRLTCGCVFVLFFVFAVSFSTGSNIRNAVTEAALNGSVIINWLDSTTAFGDLIFVTSSTANDPTEGKLYSTNYLRNQSQTSPTQISSGFRIRAATNAQRDKTACAHENNFCKFSKRLTFPFSFRLFFHPTRPDAVCFAGTDDSTFSGVVCCVFEAANSASTLPMYSFNDLALPTVAPNFAFKYPIIMFKSQNSSGWFLHAWNVTNDEFSSYEAAISTTTLNVIGPFARCNSSSHISWISLTTDTINQIRMLFFFFFFFF